MAEALTVRFHRSLYATEPVGRAAERFARFVPSVEERDADVLVTFADVPDTLRERLGDEFRNHALFEVVVAARQAAGC